MSGNNVALYLDFENLAISAHTQYPLLKKPLRVDLIVDYAKSQGNVCIRRSYADWSKEPCSLYVSDLMEHAFELVFLPQMTVNGKNGADLRMTMDAFDDMLTSENIDAFMIGSGDTDFIHLVRKIQQKGKKVIIVGFKNTVGRIIKLNCNEFKSVDELLGDSTKDDIVVDDEKFSTARDIIIRYIRGKDPKGPINLSAFKSGMINIEPSFSEKDYGFRSFKEFVTHFVGDVVIKIDEEYETGHPMVILRTWEELSSDFDEKPVEEFITKQLKYQADQDVRKRIILDVLDIFSKKDVLTINEMIESIFIAEKGAISKTKLRSFLLALGEGRLFKFAEVEYIGDIYSMPQILIEPIPSVDNIDQIYVQRVADLILKKFPGIGTDRIIVLLNKKSKKK